MITIIDYKAGNIASIKNMLKKIGVQSIISDKVEDIESADKLILPGVGSFDHGMQKLKEYRLIDVILKRANEGVPLLGICLGAQILGYKSEEGQEKGLGLIDMDIVKFDDAKLPDSYKIPHMGWTDIYIKQNSPLFKDMYEEPRFYFVHTYHFKVKKKEEVLTTSNYGYEFVSSVQRNNIYGVQFHPEKSHKFGIKFLENFVLI